MRRADAEAVGGLDERYFMYTEDVDFCAAIRARGRRILFTPDVEVVHLRANQEATRTRAIDEQFLREVAEAVPELDPDQWLDDYRDPASEDRVRADAMLAAQLKLPAEPAVVVSGPGGQIELDESPTIDDVESAVAQVSTSD